MHKGNLRAGWDVHAPISPHPTLLHPRRMDPSRQIHETRRTSTLTSFDTRGRAPETGTRGRGPSWTNAHAPRHQPSRSARVRWREKASEGGNRKKGRGVRHPAGAPREKGALEHVAGKTGISKIITERGEQRRRRAKKRKESRNREREGGEAGEKWREYEATPRFTPAKEGHAVRNPPMGPAGVQWRERAPTLLILAPSQHHFVPRARDVICGSAYTTYTAISDQKDEKECGRERTSSSPLPPPPSSVPAPLPLSVSHLRIAYMPGTLRELEIHVSRYCYLRDAQVRKTQGLSEENGEKERRQGRPTRVKSKKGRERLCTSLVLTPSSRATIGGDRPCSRGAARANGRS
ncbi:hypothetical protein B0H13DRAFT_1919808 [Mycena leptocephala]|nr:hypothetical protein B0H13DRAFT_1919808 [Mycena leptocephala]